LLLPFGDEELLYNGEIGKQIYQQQTSLNQAYLMKELQKKIPFSEYLSGQLKVWEKMNMYFPKNWKSWEIVILKSDKKNYKLRKLRNEWRAERLENEMRKRSDIMPQFLWREWEFILIEWIQNWVLFEWTSGMKKYEDMWKIFKKWNHLSSDKNFVKKLNKWIKDNISFFEKNKDDDELYEFYYKFYKKLEQKNPFIEEYVRSQLWDFHWENLIYDSDWKLKFIDEGWIFIGLHGWWLWQLLTSQKIISLSSKRSKVFLNYLFKWLWDDFFSWTDKDYYHWLFLDLLHSALTSKSSLWQDRTKWLLWKKSQLLFDLVEDKFGRFPVIPTLLEKTHYSPWDLSNNIIALWKNSIERSL